MPYVPALDGLRAVAILVVLAFHARVPGFESGSMGVDVFFVLSGCLITRLLLAEHQKTGSIGVLSFYGRRFRRLYPPLALMLTVYVCVAPLVIPGLSQATHAGDAALAGLYVSNLVRAAGYSMNYLSHSWSLALEQQFYLLWPLVMLATSSWPSRRRVILLASLFFASSLWRWHQLLSSGDIVPVYYGVASHSSGLLLGAIIAHVPKRRVPAGAIAGVAGLGGAMIITRDNETAMVLSGQLLAELSAAALILTEPRWLGLAPLAWLGRMSYGLYLWHYPITRLMWLSDWHWSLTLGVGFAMALTLAVLSYHTVEAAARRRRNPAAAGRLAVTG